MVSKELDGDPASGRLGHRHVHIRPRTPQLIGKVERSHRTDQEGCYQLLRYKGDVDLERGSTAGSSSTTAWSVRRYPDCAKAHLLLGWEPCFTLEDGSSGIDW